jgi:hypothetical protein
LQTAGAREPSASGIFVERLCSLHLAFCRFRRLCLVRPLKSPLRILPMDIFDQIKSGNLSVPAMALLVALGIVTLYVAYKIGRLILKVFCILVGLAVIVAAISWFLLRH